MCMVSTKKRRDKNLLVIEYEGNIWSVIEKEWSLLGYLQETFAFTNDFCCVFYLKEKEAAGATFDFVVKNIKK